MILLSLTEVAVRWSVMPFDVIGWSTDGLLALSIAVPPVKTDPAEALSGLANVEASHLLPLFRRDGTPSPTIVIRRVKAGEGRLYWIVEPMEGIRITAAECWSGVLRSSALSGNMGFSTACMCPMPATVLRAGGVAGRAAAARQGHILCRTHAPDS